MSIPTFKLLDGSEIPWLAWGNGTGGAKQKPIEMGKLALEAGINHIDTAQGYNNEPETQETLQSTNVKRSDIWLTSKLSQEDGATDKDPIPKENIRASVEQSIKSLGTTPDLFLIHNPFVPPPGQLVDAWKIFEQLKDQGVLKSIGVSNFRPQDLEEILAVAKHKPVVNQIEYHPYLLTHLAPVLEIHKKHGIVTAAYGPLSPILRHPDGGPIKPILERIAKRLSAETGEDVDAAAVLLLWTRAMDVVAIGASGNPDRIKGLARVSKMSDLKKEDVDDITEAGKKIHFRAYSEHMVVDFPAPDLPEK